MIAKEIRPPPSGDQEDHRSRSKRDVLASGAGVTMPPLLLDELLSKSDFLSLHIPLTADTADLIAERELALMKPSAVVINAARGGIVNEKGAGNLYFQALFLGQNTPPPHTQTPCPYTNTFPPT